MITMMTMTLPRRFIWKTILRLGGQVENDNWESNAQNKLLSAIKTLDERSQHILRARWLDDEKTTLQELADTYQVSAERIRQLEKNAMNKLKACMDV